MFMLPPDTLGMVADHCPFASRSALARTCKAGCSAVQGDVAERAQAVADVRAAMLSDAHERHERAKQVVAARCHEASLDRVAGAITDRFDRVAGAITSEFGDWATSWLDPGLDRMPLRSGVAGRICSAPTISMAVEGMGRHERRALLHDLTLPATAPTLAALAREAGQPLENLADTAHALVYGLLESPGFCEQLLDPEQPKLRANWRRVVESAGPRAPVVWLGGECDRDRVVYPTCLPNKQAMVCVDGHGLLLDAPALQRVERADDAHLPPGARPQMPFAQWCSTPTYKGGGLTSNVPARVVTRHLLCTGVFVAQFNSQHVTFGQCWPPMPVPYDVANAPGALESGPQVHECVSVLRRLVAIGPRAGAVAQEGRLQFCHRYDPAHGGAADRYATASSLLLGENVVLFTPPGRRKWSMRSAPSFW